MDEIVSALRRFQTGDTSITEAKAEILRAFPGCRSPAEALLLADFVEETALNLRQGRATITQASADLIGLCVPDGGGTAGRFSTCYH